ncbi:MAG: hypothetical protein NDI75_15825 [Candidatus Didemnitutus sp.]|jgi:hypothetical protein|nr:hypothetical protein [Candidatus Didemnitutus sp.]
MSDNPQAYAFPQRTPVFTAVVVILAAIFCGWLVNRSYRPAPAFDNRGTANPADFEESARWKFTAEGRAQALAELRQKEQAQAMTYGWVDQSKGIARLPLDRAVELTVRDHAKK